MADELREAEEQIAAMSAAHRPFVIPLLRALESEGGETRAKVAKKRIGDDTPNLKRWYDMMCERPSASA